MTARDHVVAYLDALPLGTPVATLPVAWVAELVARPAEAAPVSALDALPWPERVRRMHPDTHLSVHEAAKAVGCSEHGVHRRRNRVEMEARGLQPLRFYQPGGKGTAVHFKAGDVVRWLDSQTARSVGGSGLRRVA